MSEALKTDVRDFWNREACGERYGGDQDMVRYEREPEILSFAGFEASRDKSVLEIGVGMGGDFLRWLRAGARATGIDFTERAVALTRARIVSEGHTVAIGLADGEDLPFVDRTFDVVYSWGVLHHTPNTQTAIQEAIRVLKPGGILKVMVYHRHSWVALAAWLRYCALRGRPFQGLRDAVANIESPGTQAFTQLEARSLVDGLQAISVRPCLTFWDKRLVPLFWRLGGHRLGWFLLLEGTKPVI